MKKFILILLTIISTHIYSHPHMQILNRTSFEFNEDKIKGVWLEWEFDAYFSADIIMTYDINEDGIFDDKETIDVYNNAFISLKDFNYFTYIRTGDKRISPEEVKDFSVFTDDEKNLVYKFYVPLDYLDVNEFYLSVYDFSYFCACFYQEVEPVIFMNSDNFEPSYNIAKNEEYPIYFDPYAGPGETTVYTEWEEGLNEIVVQEIHVKY